MDHSRLDDIIKRGGIVTTDYSWGEAYWKIIYNSILSNHSNTKKLLNNLAAFLPCESCKRHYVKYKNRNPPPNHKNKSKLFQWVYNLEKSIAKRNGKSAPDRYSQLKIFREPPVVNNTRSIVAKQSKAKKRRGCSCGK